jgi:hypothetical protein
MVLPLGAKAKLYSLLVGEINIRLVMFFD